MSEIQTAPSKVSIVKREREWLGQHAEYRGNQWFCKKTGKEILMVEAVHSIWKTAPVPALDLVIREPFSISIARLAE